MPTLQGLKAVDFFENKNEMLELSKKNGIKNIHLAPLLDFEDPDITKINLIIDTLTCTLTQLATFETGVREMYSKYAGVSIDFMSSRMIDKTIASDPFTNQGLEKLRKSSIPLEDLNNHQPLEDQWENQLKLNTSLSRQKKQRI